MRPRVFPAEDWPPNVWMGDEVAASMRPRVFPAEDGGECRPGDDRRRELQ